MLLKQRVCVLLFFPPALAASQAALHNVLLSAS